MKGTVASIMNEKLLYVQEGDRMTLVRQQIIRFGVSGVPVLDEQHKPVGFVSLRDLDDKGETVRTSAPVGTILRTASIEEAAHKLALSTYHQLVVVDEDGVAIGVVSATDCLRALLGISAWHPTAFDAAP